ncbi:MAG: DUF899 domain-containing protein [Gemmatimonadales bacterium]
MPTKSAGDIKGHKVVSRKQWLAARKRLLAKEKAFTKQRDALNRQRRALPWVKVDKDYTFDGPGGPVTLAELFDGRSQLIVYHFMFTPTWDDGCKHCSFWADNFNPVIVHINHRGAAFAAISRAPLAKLERFKARMGWSFRWVSSHGNDFNADYHVSFTPEEVESGEPLYNVGTMAPGMADREGVSVFYRDARGRVFHTYSTFARGIDLLNTAYNYIDLLPKGRDEADGPQRWVRYHDRYED